MRTRPKGALAAVVAVVVAAAGLSAAPERSAATFRGHPGAIVFSRAPAGGANANADIWISRNGKQRRLTTSRQASEAEPAFSRDGKLIVFARRASGNFDIWVMRASGRGKRRVTDSTLSDDFNPSFFPSGRSIVFERYDGERFSVMTVRLDGSRLKRAASNASDPAVSPNGRFLAFSRYRDRVGGIRLRNLRTGRARRLTTGSAQELDFAPSGRRIVFTGQRSCRRGANQLRFGLLTVNLGGRVQRLRFSCGREWIEPSWAPNGKRIVAVRKKLAGTARGLRFRLVMLRPSGRLADGAPRHRRGTSEMFPAWQPIRR